MYSSPKRSALLSGLLHAAVIVLVLTATKVTTPPAGLLHPVLLTGRILAPYLPHTAANGGGGGGGRDPLPASRGPLPPTARRQFVPPAVVILNDHSRLAIDPTIVGPPDIVIPAIQPYGDPNGILGRLSSGPGSGGGIGSGEDGGVGPGRGPGAGPGNGGGISGEAGIRGVETRPVLLWKVEPEYTENARQAKLQGTVELRIEVNTRGQAQNIEVLHGLGLGLDERAIDAVKRWRFCPAYANGKPVVTTAIVDLTFQLL
jgi:periplasmic protein TonB